ncbi:MAG: hypothetical protein FRX49_07621 [Trebouxia sp. A1-2]|nr:MAG: hypothetical protein FRX49_07621 [Trebouxia sp. A1-2]
MLPDSLLRFWLMNSRGLGPTTRRHQSAIHIKPNSLGIRNNRNAVVPHHGCLGGSGVVTPLQLIRPQLLNQLPCVDLDWAFDLTHAISSTCGISIIVVALLKVSQPLLLSGCAVIQIPEAADLSVGGDALTGGEGDVTRWAVTLAEAALNAAVQMDQKEQHSTAQIKKPQEGDDLTASKKRKRGGRHQTLQKEATSTSLYASTTNSNAASTGSEAQEGSAPLMSTTNLVRPSSASHSLKEALSNTSTASTAVSVLRTLAARQAVFMSGNIMKLDACNGPDLVGPLRNTVVGSLRYKAKGAFTANHEALDDLNRVIQGEVHQGIQAVSGCALDGKLAADEGPNRLPSAEGRLTSRKASLLMGSLVSRTVPSRNTTRMSFSVW